MSIDQVQLSKFLSFVLRHKPDEIGLALSPDGWANIDELIEKASAVGTQFDRSHLLHVVATSDKKRFSVSDDGLRIRAAQGHSVAVELGLLPEVPPAVLYHGTAMRFLESIRSNGLKPQARQHVHLLIDEATSRWSAAWKTDRLESRCRCHACDGVSILSRRQWSMADRRGAAKILGRKVINDSCHLLP